MPAYGTGVIGPKRRGVYFPRAQSFNLCGREHNAGESFGRWCCCELNRNWEGDLMFAAAHNTRASGVRRLRAEQTAPRQMWGTDIAMIN